MKHELRTLLGRSLEGRYTFLKSRPHARLQLNLNVPISLLNKSQDQLAHLLLCATCRSVVFVCPLTPTFICRSARLHLVAALGINKHCGKPHLVQRFTTSRSIASCHRTGTEVSTWKAIGDLSTCSVSRFPLCISCRDYRHSKILSL